jgi:hypothetical protein
MLHPLFVYNSTRRLKWKRDKQMLYQVNVSEENHKSKTPDDYLAPVQRQTHTINDQARALSFLSDLHTDSTLKLPELVL